MKGLKEMLALAVLACACVLFVVVMAWITRPDISAGTGAFITMLFTAIILTSATSSNRWD
jgi:hypothetical protein